MILELVGEVSVGLLNGLVGAIGAYFDINSIKGVGDSLYFHAMIGFFGDFIDSIDELEVV